MIDNQLRVFSNWFQISYIPGARVTPKYNSNCTNIIANDGGKKRIPTIFWSTVNCYSFFIEPIEIEELKYALVRPVRGLYQG